MPTVIDSLLVELGLDPSDYLAQQKEVERETERSAKAIEQSQTRATKETEKQRNEAQKKQDVVTKRNEKEARERERKAKQEAAERKKFTDETTESIGRMGMTLAAAVLGFEGLKGGISYLGNLSEGQANLGRTATRIGVTAEALNIYGKAVELAGGKTEDVVDTFGKLSQEFTQFKITGKPGPLLQLLTQKGVAFRDAKGDLLDIGTILDGLSKKTQNMSDQDRANLFAQAGISQGVINRMLETTAEQDKQLEKARELNRVNNLAVKNAEDFHAALSGAGQAVAAMGTSLNSVVIPKLTQGLNLLSDWLGDRDTNESSRVFFGGADKGERAQAARLKYNLAALDRGTPAQSAESLVAPKAGTLAARNNNPGNLEDSNGNFRIFKTLAEGQAAQRADIEAKIRKGYDTINAIVTRYEGTDGKKDPYALAAYISRAEKLTGKDRNSKLSEGDITALINAMTVVESGLPDTAMRGGPSVGATPGATVARGAGGNNAQGGNTTSVQIDKIEVNSSNANPAAVADQTGAAIQRKLTVAQANVGQT